MLDLGLRLQEGGHVLIDHRLGNEVGLEVGVQIRKTDDTVIEDEVEHFGAIGVGCVTGLEGLLTVGGANVLIAGVSHGFQDSAHALVILNCQGNGKTEGLTVIADLGQLRLGPGVLLCGGIGTLT